MATNSQPQVLYRHFDKHGTLLYVGISATLGGRIKAHQRNSQWFNTVDRITLEHFATRGDVLQAERDAITTEHPLHNKVYNRLPWGDFPKVFADDVQDYDWVDWKQVADALFLTEEELEIAVEWPGFPEPTDAYTPKVRWRAVQIGNWVRVKGEDLLGIWHECAELTSYLTEDELDQLEEARLSKPQCDEQKVGN
jgi:hypothetical protein